MLFSIALYWPIMSLRLYTLNYNTHPTEHTLIAELNTGTPQFYVLTSNEDI